MPNFTADENKLYQAFRNGVSSIFILLQLSKEVIEQYKQEISSLKEQLHYEIEEEIKMKKQIDDKEAHIMLLINEGKRLEKQLSQSVSKEKIEKTINDFWSLCVKEPDITATFILQKLKSKLLSLSQNDTHPEKNNLHREKSVSSNQGENFQDKEEKVK